jgi:valyl-tRNA synthetase
MNVVVVACCRKGHVIEEQMKALGTSLDWSRNFFTLDEVYIHLFLKIYFVHMHKLYSVSPCGGRSVHHAP